MATPAVVEAEPVAVKYVAAAGDTTTLAEPLMEEVAVSVTVTDCEPDVLSVTLKVPTPLVSVALAGRTAWPSELVNCTVPV